MPLFFEFKPKTRLKKSDEIGNNLPSSIFKIPYLAYQGSKTRITSDNDGFIVKVEMEVKGLCVLDDESVNMLHSILCERLIDCELPFYVSGMSKNTHALPEEAIFLHERLKPMRSKNSRLLAKIDGLTIPEEFRCPLSGDIMDDPVYDIRSPGVCYDQDFLRYFLRKSEKKLMPHTNIPSQECFIKPDFNLKIKIVHFVEIALKAAEFESRKIILEKLKIVETVNKQSLNQALRRASMSSDADADDIRLLLSLGADVNSQDENPQKRNTALHWAIRENKIMNAIELVRSAARIDIPDANGVTASQLMIERLDAQDPAIQPLLLNCHLLGLEIPGVVQVQRSQNPPNNERQSATNRASLFSNVRPVQPEPHTQIADIAKSV